MNLNKEVIYNYLSECNLRVGGYTGRDIEIISRILGLNKKTVRRYIENWSKKDPRFAELKYVGQYFITLTFEDIAILDQLLSENITIRKQEIIREINDKRIKRGDTAISQSTLYEIINNFIQTLTNGAPQEHHWLFTQGIEVSDMYNLTDARTMLSNTFIYSGLKIFGGIDIDGIALGVITTLVPQKQLYKFLLLLSICRDIYP